MNNPDLLKELRDKFNETKKKLGFKSSFEERLFILSEQGFKIKG